MKSIFSINYQNPSRSIGTLRVIHAYPTLLLLTTFSIKNLPHTCFSNVIIVFLQRYIIYSTC